MPNFGNLSTWPHVALPTASASPSTHRRPPSPSLPAHRRLCPGARLQPLPRRPPPPRPRSRRPQRRPRRPQQLPSPPRGRQMARQQRLRSLQVGGGVGGGGQRCLTTGACWLLPACDLWHACLVPAPACVDATLCATPAPAAAPPAAPPAPAAPAAPAPPAAPAAPAAAPPASVEAATKEVKKLAVAEDSDVLLETEAQREARHAEVCRWPPGCEWPARGCTCAAGHAMRAVHAATWHSYCTSCAIAAAAAGRWLHALTGCPPCPLCPQVRKTLEEINQEDPR